MDFSTPWEKSESRFSSFGGEVCFWFEDGRFGENVTSVSDVNPCLVL